MSRTPRFKFGDIIENGYASDSNPKKRGVYLWSFNRTGRMNPGKHVKLLHDDGRTGELCISDDDKMTVVGTIFDAKVSEAIAAKDAEIASLREALGKVGVCPIASPLSTRKATDMSDELKPCPFCGSSPSFESNVADSVVRCTSCSARVAVSLNPLIFVNPEGIKRREDGGAVADWNRRIPAPLQISVGDDALLKIGRIILAEAPADATAWRDVSLDSIRAALEPAELSMGGKFGLGDRVRKTKGSSWQGRVVGFYSTELTPIGYAVESEREPGSVQIYPEAALAALSSPMEGGE